MIGKELKELKLGLVTIVRIFMDYPVPIIIVAGSLSCTGWHLADYMQGKTRFLKLIGTLKAQKECKDNTESVDWN